MKRGFRRLLAWVFRCPVEETEHLEGDPEEMALMLLISYLSAVGGALLYHILQRLI